MDLQPHLSLMAATGAMLYHPFETNWNEAGNHLAGETVAAELRGLGLLR